MSEVEFYDSETMEVVLKAVIALQGRVRRTLGCRTFKDDPNYNNVHSQLVKMGVEIDVKTTVSYLREAERLGYIEGRGGFYNRPGGGSKRWHFIMLPDGDSAGGNP